MSDQGRLSDTADVFDPAEGDKANDSLADVGSAENLFDDELPSSKSGERPDHRVLDGEGELRALASSGEEEDTKDIDSASEGEEPPQDIQDDEDDEFEKEVFGDDNESLNDLMSDNEFSEDDAVETVTSEPRRKRPRSRGDTPDYPSKYRATGEDSDTLVQGNTDMQTKLDQVKRDFEQAIDAMKPRRRRKQFDEKALDDMLQRLTNMMKQAAVEDHNALESGRPRLTKLKLLPEVKKQLERRDRHDYLLDNNILEGIRAWMEPMGDGSLPSYGVRKSMFEALDKLPINRDSLRESGIGKVVMFYKKCKSEVPELQRLADRLITKWSRLVINKSEDYRASRLRSSSEAQHVVPARRRALPAALRSRRRFR